MGYVTLSALKSFGGFEGTDEDTLLTTLINAATKAIENETGRIFQLDAEYEQVFYRYNGMEFNRFDGQKLYFYETLAYAPSAITDSPTVVMLPEDGPPYYGMYLVEGTWAYPYVGVTGYWCYSTTPPEPIQYACMRLAKWMYDMRTSGRTDQVVITPEGQVLLPQGLPDDVLSILAPYKQVRAL